MSISYIGMYLYLLFLGVLKVSNVTFAPYLGIFFNISVIFIILINLSFVMIKKSFKQWIVPFVITILFLFLLITKQIKIAPLLAILVYLMCNNASLVKSKTFIKYNLLILVITFCMIVFCNFIGIVPDVLYSNLLGENKGASLGFSHPNVTGDIVVGIILALAILLDYLRLNHKINFKFFYYTILVFSLFITLFIYHLTQCRGLLYFGIITFIGLLVINFKLFRNIIYTISIPLAMVIPALIIYLDYNYNYTNKFYSNINTLLSRRMNMQSIIMRTYPVHLVQKNKETSAISQLVSGTQTSNNLNPQNVITIDNSFLDILEMCGIIGIIISGYIILKGMVLAIKMKRYIVCVLLLAWVIYNCVSSDLFSIYLISPLLYIFSLKDNNYKFNINHRGLLNS